MKIFYMLVGLPGVGKTTWIDKNLSFIPSIISTDDILELLSVRYGMTYNQLFDPVTYSFAEKMMYKIAEYYFVKNDPIIIWDQTNLTKKIRKRKLDIVPDTYIKYCVYFPPPDNHMERLSNRTGKTIPDNIIESMKKSFEMPFKDEGFSEVIIGYT